MLKAGLIRNVGLALVTTALAFGVAEVAVRLFVPVRNVGPSYTVFDPVYGKRLKPSFHATRYTPEFTNTFTTNSLGFRGPEPDSLPTRPVLFIGDSYTMGYGVNDGEEFPELVRRALVAARQRIPVVNAGTGDNGNGRWVKFLRNEGARLSPRLVVLQVSDNDFGDNLKEGLFTIGPSGDLVEKPVPRPGWPRLVQAWIEAVPGLAYSHLVGLSRQAVPAPRGRGTDTGPAGGTERRDHSDQLTYRLIQETLQICERNGWPVLALEVGVGEPRLAELRSTFDQRGIDLIVVPASTVRPDLYYRIDRHWNSRGHQWVATSVLDHLKADGILRD
jgi:hypothetical protein